MASSQRSIIYGSNSFQDPSAKETAWRWQSLYDANEHRSAQMKLYVRKLRVQAQAINQKVHNNCHLRHLPASAFFLKLGSAESAAIPLATRPLSILCQFYPCRVHQARLQRRLCNRVLWHWSRAVLARNMKQGPACIEFDLHWLQRTWKIKRDQQLASTKGGCLVSTVHSDRGTISNEVNNCTFCQSAQWPQRLLQMVRRTSWKENLSERPMLATTNRGCKFG